METIAELSDKAFKEHIKTIVNNPFNAIIELIANAYDAGAKNLIITWPLMNNLEKAPEFKSASFKDDGHGMSYNDFLEIWKMLSYNRIEKQGKYVTLDYDGEKITREVYGKNGKGRHSPLAFSNKYTVKTVHNKELSIFNIESDNHGFSIKYSDPQITDKPNGTEIIFDVNPERNKNVDEIRETIASRFLKDNSFKIILNNEVIDLTDIDEDNINKIECDCNGEIIEILQLESIRGSKYNKFHGISWKIGNRLIQDKSWDNQLDGRRKLSKKINYIISADILKDYTNDNMTAFIENDFVKKVQGIIYSCINKSISLQLKDEYDADKRGILLDNIADIKNLSYVNREELGLFISEVQQNCPTIKYNDLKAVSEILIKLKKSSSGYGLLHKISKLSSEDYDKLNEILSKWDVQSAKMVLDEIKWRLDIINQLKKKVNNPNTDELHELQPIFDKGLWIFGPEYESIEFTSNRQLCTVVEKIFKKNGDNIQNPLLRPDYVVIPDDFSVSFHSSDSFDDDGEVNGISKLLIIELKKGGSKIGLNEYQQAQKYVKQLIDGKYITKTMDVDVYVLGSTVDIDDGTMGSNVKIIPMPYHIIISRAEKRLFNLDKRIRDIKNISESTDDEIMNEVLGRSILDEF